MRVRLIINGEARQLEVDPRQSLLDVLRETLDLTGTKKGCNQGACGACTILLDGKRVLSCLTLAVMHEGAQVTCIAEGHACSAQEIRFWMSGNICRCGAYPGIVAAIADAAAKSRR